MYGDYADELLAQGRPQYIRELSRLVVEAIKNPNLLDIYITEWLLSPDAHRANVFFILLGCSDTGLLFRERIEALGQRANGAAAFAAYWEGWAARERQAAETRLDYLMNSNAVTGEAIILAIARLGANQVAVDRIQSQIRAGRVTLEYVANALAFRKFMQELATNQCEELLRTMAGETFEHGEAAVSMLVMWDHFARPLSGSLAKFVWQCLEQTSFPKSPRDAWTWKFDRLAAKLVQDNPEEGFRFLERFLRKSEEDRNHWCPFEPYGRAQFWKALYTRDRQRFMQLLLDAARTHAPARHHLSWYLRERLNQEAIETCYSPLQQVIFSMPVS